MPHDPPCGVCRIVEPILREIIESDLAVVHKRLQAIHTLVDEYAQEVAETDNFVDGVQIIQILLAEGWYVAYKRIDTSNNVLVPLTCWALCEDVTGKQSVRGMVSLGFGADASSHLCDELAEDFVGYTTHHDFFEKYFSTS